MTDEEIRVYWKSRLGGGGGSPGKCPTCGSPAPKFHPAVQCEGEVQICRDAWHVMATVTA